MTTTGAEPQAGVFEEHKRCDARHRHERTEIAMLTGSRLSFERRLA